MDESLAPQRHSMTTGETRHVAVDMRGKLEAGQLLTGTPTVEDLASVLSIASAQVSTTDLTINGETVATGQAVTFRVSGGSAGVEYTIRVTCSTTAPTQTLVAKLRLRVRPNT